MGPSLRRDICTGISEPGLYWQVRLGCMDRFHGYRWMYMKCKQHYIIIRKEDIRMLLSFIGSHVRKARRLRRRQYFAQEHNFVWHIDSYDKLKPYGIWHAASFGCGPPLPTAIPKLCWIPQAHANWHGHWEHAGHLQRNDEDDRVFAPVL